MSDWPRAIELECGGETHMLESRTAGWDETCKLTRKPSDFYWMKSRVFRMDQAENKKCCKE